MAIRDHRDCPLAEVNRGLLVPFCGGLLMLFVIAAGSLGWATAVPLSAAVHALGTVVVDSNRKIVQHQNGGVVAAIHVRDGSRVAAGDVLVELEDVELTVALKTVRPLLEVVLARRARLLAERAGQDTIDFPADFQAQASPSAQQAMSDQIRIFNARRAALKSRIASLENEREQSRVQARGLQTQLENQDERVRLTEEELATNNGLIDRGYVPRRRALELGRALADLKGRRAELAADLAEAKKQIEHSELEIERVRNSFAEAVETEFQEVEKGRIELLERVQLVTRRLEDLKIRAPVSGVVVNMAVHTLQGVVAPGASILEIVPEDDPLVFEVQISPRDVNDVQMGMSAIVHLPGREQGYPDGLKATLETVSADSMIDPLNGRAYYLARLRATPGDPAGSGADLKPGMPVDVLLLRGSRTLLDYLVAPLSDLLAQALYEP